MARKSKRTYRRKRVRSRPLAHELNLGSLADNDVIESDSNEVVAARSQIAWIRGIWVLENIVNNEGPTVFGVAHSDYTAAEIEEWLENATSWDEGDLIAQERGKRKIKVIGAFDATTSEAARYNDGRPVFTRLGWILLTGQGLSFWAFNKSGAAYTGSKNMIFQGTAGLRDA